MAQQGNLLKHRIPPLLAKTCDPMFLSCCCMYVHIIRKSNWCIRVMKYIPMWKNFLCLFPVLSILFFLLPWPISLTLPSFAISFPLPRIISTAHYPFRSGLMCSWWLIPPQESLSRSYGLVLAPCFLLMLMDRAISQMHSLTKLSVQCIVKQPFCCWIPKVSATHWPTATQPFMTQRQPWWVSIWIVLASATTDFCNQKASHYIVGSQCWSMIKWGMSNASYSEHESGELNISSKVMRYCSRGESGVSKVLVIIRMVGR